jgi:omega-amidase
MNQIVGVQLDTVWEDKQASHGRVLQLLAEADVRAGALVVLPEMFATGFSLEIERTAEPAAGGLSGIFLSNLARDLRCFVTGGVITSASAGHGFNEAVAYGPDGAEMGRYRKIYPFTFGREHERHLAGDRIVGWQWGECRVAPFICYDLRFPEVFRLAAYAGARLMTVIANWPSPRQEHWIRLLQARAIENQAYVVGINRCGSDPNLTYAGGSRVIDPQGRVLVEAGESECVITAEIDLPALEQYRRSFPALADVRPEFLNPI